MNGNLNRISKTGIGALIALMATACAHGKIEERPQVSDPEIFTPGDTKVVAIVIIEVVESRGGKKPVTFGKPQAIKFGDDVGDIKVKPNGDIDLSEIGKSGDVVIMIDIEAPGYSFGAGLGDPAEFPYTAIGLGICSDNDCDDNPTINYGAEHWPEEFGPPKLTNNANKLFVVDSDEDQSAYLYEVLVSSRETGPVSIDPRIKNGGHN